jgi:hypothetical protein
MRVELQSRLLSFDKEIDDVVLVASAATRLLSDVPVTVYSHDHKWLDRGARRNRSEPDTFIRPEFVAWYGFGVQDGM